MILAQFLIAACIPAFASPELDGALGILDSRTSSHWGEDNLVWVVHYPERLIDPWVKSYAEKRKLTAAQTEQYRKAFTDELKTGAATAVMLSVHAFGASPLALAPVAASVTLIAPSGKRVQPMVYEKKLDSPIHGLVQGFVFFPLQKDDNFKIAVKGLIADRETIFTFGGSEHAIATTPPSAENISKRPPGGSAEPKDVIVKIPTTKPPVPPSPPKAPAAVSRDEGQAEPEFSLQGETYAPTAPSTSSPSPDSPTPQDVPQAPQAQQKPPLEPPKPALTPKQTLDLFLKAWMRGDAGSMYGLLSEESRGRISRELFEKDVLGAGGFRQGLRDGYRVVWEGDSSAKVTVSRRILLMRALSSKRFDFTEEDGAPRIAW